MYKPQVFDLMIFYICMHPYDPNPRGHEKHLLPPHFLLPLSVVALPASQEQLLSLLIAPTFSTASALTSQKWHHMYTLMLGFFHPAQTLKFKSRYQ